MKIEEFCAGDKLIYAGSTVEVVALYVGIGKVLVFDFNSETRKLVSFGTEVERA